MLLRLLNRHPFLAYTLAISVPLTGSLITPTAAILREGYFFSESVSAPVSRTQGISFLLFYFYNIYLSRMAMES